jgi:hypothetical protein
MREGRVMLADGDVPVARGAYQWGGGGSSAGLA